MNQINLKENVPVRIQVPDKAPTPQVDTKTSPRGRKSLVLALIVVTVCGLSWFGVKANDFMEIRAKQNELESQEKIMKNSGKTADGYRNDIKLMEADIDSLLIDINNITNRIATKESQILDTQNDWTKANARVQVLKGELEGKTTPQNQ